MVDDFLVIGTEAAFKQSVDLREDGDVLADADRYKDAVADLGDDTLGHYYVDTPALFELASSRTRPRRSSSSSSSACSRSTSSGR